MGKYVRFGKNTLIVFLGNYGLTIIEGSVKTMNEHSIRQRKW